MRGEQSAASLPAAGSLINRDYGGDGACERARPLPLRPPLSLHSPLLRTTTFRPRNRPSVKSLRLRNSASVNPLCAFFIARLLDPSRIGACSRLAANKNRVSSRCSLDPIASIEPFSTLHVLRAERAANGNRDIGGGDRLPLDTEPFAGALDGLIHASGSQSTV